MHQTQWSPERPLPPPVSLTSQSHHEKPPEVTCTSRGMIRKVTIEKGFDPRDFVLFAFGGAGPTHAGVFARELGVRKVIVPQKETAAVWCAFGAAAADVLHVHEQVDIMASPFDLGRVNARLATLAADGRRTLGREGVEPERQRLHFSLDVRPRGQINEVEVSVPGQTLGPGDLDALRADFFTRYELLYGRGSSFPGARIEIVTFRCRATAPTPKPELRRADRLEDGVAPEARTGARAVYWAERKAVVDTPVYDGQALRPGNRLAGPAVIETPDTTVVVHPGQSLRIDAYRNFEIGLGSE